MHWFIVFDSISLLDRNISYEIEVIDFLISVYNLLI